MEEYVYRVRKYLPIKFPDEEADEFVKYLEESYIENTGHKKYQFAFKAFHMLYMVFVYKVTWFLNKNNTAILEELKKEYSIKTKKSGGREIADSILTITKMFHQSQINEAKSILKLITLLDGFDNNDIDKCLTHIEVRNHCSHATGKIYYNEKAVDHFINDELGYIEKIQKKVKSDFVGLFNEFLNKNWNQPFIGGDIENWLKENNISQKDLEFFIEADLSLFKKKSDNERIVYQKLLYLTFVSEAAKHIESERNIFLERLPMFVFGLKAEIKIKIDEKEKIVPMQKILDERLFPLFGALTDKEKKTAEAMLKFS